jgi:hypothetical protein
MQRDESGQRAHRSFSSKCTARFATTSTPEGRILVLGRLKFGEREETRESRCRRNKGIDI